MTLRKNCTSHTKPFTSPTSIPVSRPAPYAFVKLGRAGKHGRPPSSPSSFPFFVSWCLCGNPFLRGCHGQAKRRHALRAGTHDGAFGLVMAHVSAVAAAPDTTQAHIARHRTRAGRAGGTRSCGSLDDFRNFRTLKRVWISGVVGAATHTALQTTGRRVATCQMRSC